MFKLVISDDEGKQTVVPLVRDEITIGRKEGNTIRLTERNVSRRHARLVKANGKFVVEDLHSYNGVRVNGERIGAETSLAPGDQISIGDYALALQVDGAEATVLDQASPGVADADTAMIASPGPPARLVMITPPAPGAEFALSTDKVRIGRAEDLEIWVNHRSISREHAEIQKEPDGGFRLIDLGSANGVRVNAEDVQNALLSAGDVVELGQVRFRFVAAGEHYAFDADRTVQMDAVTVEPEAGNRAPLLVAVAIVVLAVIGAIVVAFWGGDDTDESVVRPLDPESSITSPDDPYRAGLDNCRAALREVDPARAIAQADDALAARPGDEAATECRASAEDLQSQAQTFDAGVRHLEQGELEAAYFQFDSLPTDSPFRNRPQVRQAVRSYANVKLREGTEALEEGDADEAFTTANYVLNMHGITPVQLTEATQLRERSQAAGGDQEAIVATNDPPTGGGGGGRSRRGGGGGGGGRSRRGGGGTTSGGGGGTTSGGGGGTTSGGGGGTTSGGGGGTTSGGGGGGRSAGGGGGGNPEAQARECMMNGDNACIVRLLENNRARTPTALSMLIEAYRARGQTNAALRHMRTFVQRYPTHPRARAYQQILARH